MRPLARTLLVVLGLVASLREAGSAACASTCVLPALDFETPVAEETCVPVASCCSSCPAGEEGDSEPVECPLLDPTPQALIERAPVARALPEPVDVRFASTDDAPLLADLPEFDLHRIEARAGAPPGGGTRPRARPLWLLDRSLLL
jgi:hypothetical protein